MALGKWIANGFGFGPGVGPSVGRCLDPCVRLCVRLCAGVAAALALLSPAAAQEDISGQISIELNAASSTDAGCRVSFMVVNGMAQNIDGVVYETVLFDADGSVDRLTLFDFGPLPVARPRVRQFVVPQTDCADLGRVLFNGAQTCDAPALAPGACLDSLRLSSRTGIEVIG